MKILFCLEHPAHFHYFKHSINLLLDEGHECQIAARDKDVLVTLLKKSRLNYSITSKNRETLLGKFFNMFRMEYSIYSIAREFKPDLMVSCFSMYASHVAKLLDIKFIAFTQTDHAWFTHIVAEPFTDIIATPKHFSYSFGKKQIRFDGSLELAYLHPSRFRPDDTVLEDLELKNKNGFVIIRLVSTKSVHDSGSGFSRTELYKMIRYFSRESKVILSSEVKLPAIFDKYIYRISPDKFHSALYYARLCISEGSTTAVESSIIGTPAVNYERYISKDNTPLDSSELLGYLADLKHNYNLLYTFKDEKLAFRKAREIFHNPKIKKDYRERLSRLFDEKIDVSNYISNLIKKSFHD